MEAVSYSHGTKKAYDVAGCRCVVCREAKRDRDKERREKLRRRVAAGDPTLKHGTATLYSKGGCRCEPCQIAGSRSLREWRIANPDANPGHVRRWRASNPGRGREYAREQADLVGPSPRSEAKDIWTGADLEMVVTRIDLTLTELARRLGRTRQAVATARHRATHDPKWMKAAGVDDA